jgi:glycogen debranching enzyme
MGISARAFRCITIAAFALASLTVLGQAPTTSSQSATETNTLELVRPARRWEFISALGTRSGLLGDESGNLEAWVYPLKLMRNFHLRFKVHGETIEGNALARSIRVHPESTTITYAWNTFTVEETLFAPVHEPGLIVKLDIDTTEPIEVEAAFERDFQLEWPGTMGGSDIEWSPALHAFLMDENQRKFTALVGSPSATAYHAEFSSNYASWRENSIALGVIQPGKATKVIAMAASFQGLPPVEITYRKLTASYQQLLAESADYYRNYLSDRVALELPDLQLQSAYQWAQVSVLQGLVTNPYLGTGLVAGYKISADDQRPGYAWFFGRDALWTSLALDAEGDYATTRTALDFLSKYQRHDGKITHEIAQGATFVPWFDSMPYAYAAADATPLYIVAMQDYVQHSGDTAFAAEKWDSLWRAYQFLISTYDKNGWPRNDGVGHGWVEGGPLLPVKTELYQAAVSLQALDSLARLAHALGKQEQSMRLEKDFVQGKVALNRAFWIADKHRFAFALNDHDQLIDSPSVLSAVPMWFGLFDEDKAHSMIAELSKPSSASDWGMRIIPADHPKYDAAGYHSGTVWPLFTGWAAVGEYRYHQPMPAYANLRANALLTFDGALGHVAEVLSGSYYQTLSDASPHQIWSSAMVIAPLLEGIFGLDEDAASNHVSLTPHVPANWTSYAIKHLRAGTCVLDLKYTKGGDTATLAVHRLVGAGCTLDYSPAFSLRTHILGVTLNGRKTKYEVEKTVSDRHVHLHLDVAHDDETLAIQLRNDFGLSQEPSLPSLGSISHGLRVVSEQWNADASSVVLEFASSTDGVHDFDIWNPAQISSVDGAELVRDNTMRGKLHIMLHVEAEHGDAHAQVTIHFHEDRSEVKNKGGQHAD